jgi:cation transport ATPase
MSISNSFAYLEKQQELDKGKEKIAEKLRDKEIEYKEQRLEQQKKEKKIKHKVEEQEKRKEEKKKVQNDAIDLENEHTRNFQNLYDNTLYILNYNKQLETDKNNIYSYYNILIKKGENMDRKIATHESDTITNNRKTFYENQKYDKLNTWNLFFKFIYIVFLIIFLIFIFTLDSNRGKGHLIGILILFIGYPFIINFIINKLLLGSFDKLWKFLSGTIGIVMYILSKIFNFFLSIILYFINLF